MMGRMPKGFTLLELAVVVLTIGILAMIIAPRFANAQSSSKITATAEDIKKITEAIEYFKASNGFWPLDTKVGIIPSEVLHTLKDEELFKRPTPIGGIYDYENNKNYKTVNLRIRGTNATPPPTLIDAQRLDEYLDDGVLNTGKFRTHATGGYIYYFDKQKNTKRPAP